MHSFKQSSTVNAEHPNWVIHSSITKSCHEIGPQNPKAQISSWSEKSPGHGRVTEKGWLTRSCVVKGMLAEFVCWLWFPRLFWQWHLWSWPCIPWRAGVVAPFSPGWWLSNFSSCLQQALSLWVTTVGWGEKAFMWEHPLLDLISPLNHVKELWRKGPKLRTISMDHSNTPVEMMNA